MVLPLHNQALLPSCSISCFITENYLDIQKICPFLLSVCLKHWCLPKSSLNFAASPTFSLSLISPDYKIQPSNVVSRIISPPLPSLFLYYIQMPDPYLQSCIALPYILSCDPLCSHLSLTLTQCSLLRCWFFSCNFDFFFAYFFHAFYISSSSLTWNILPVSLLPLLRFHLFSELNSPLTTILKLFVP